MKKRLESILLTLCMVLTLLPTTASASDDYDAKLKEGWYYLRCMGNYLNLDADGNAEMRDKTNTAEGNTKFLVHYWGTGGFGLETADGRFLGVELSTSVTTNTKYNSSMNGVRVKALAGVVADKLDSNKHTFRWDIYSENNDDIWSMRPRMNVDVLMNSSGQKNADGSPIILWTLIDR